MKLRHLFWIIGGLIQLLVVAPVAHAITVSPPLFDFEIAPGANQQATITIWNDTNERETFSLLVQNFIASGEEGEQRYLDEKEPTDLASWVAVDEPTVTLDPGQQADFPILISVPQDVEPGGHYATVFFSRGGGRGDGSGVGIVEQIGVLLLVRVPGDVREDLAVESFRMKGSSPFDSLPVEFELRVRNAGSVHLRPAGTIVVKNAFGNVVARIPANPRKSAVLPDSIRKIDSVWAKTLDVPEGGFWDDVANEWRNFAIGSYTATTEITYGPQNTSLPTSSVHFWVWPWRLTLLFVLALFAAFVIIKGYNTLIVRTALKKSKG